MKSHEYKLTAREILRAVLPTLAILAILAGLLRAGARSGLMPPRAVALDPNSTVLAHQSRSAHSQHPAQIVLVGDSTCMGDVDARALSQRLPGQPRALNLGLLIWFDFKTYAEVLSDFAAANPGQVRAVVLLVTPEKLAGGRNEGQQDFWRNIRLDEREPASAAALTGAPPDWLGLKCLRENLLGHLLATPLRGHGEGTVRFGFSSDIEAYMTAHDGSNLNFGRVVRPRQPPQAGWTFAADLQAESEGFRAKIPTGAKLFIGLTPLAQSYSPPGDCAQRIDMLNQWNRWMKADALLTNLPPFLPDVFFAGASHLNELGQRRFTAVLAGQLAPLLAHREGSLLKN